MFEFFFLLGLLVVGIPLFYMFYRGIKEEGAGPITKTQISQTKVVIDQDELAKKPYICGECGTGMDVMDYVCPQCMSKEKLKVE